MLKFKINLKNLIYYDKLNFLNFKSVFFKVIFLKLNFKLTLIKRLFFKKYLSMFKHMPKVNFFPKKVNIMVYNMIVFKKKISSLLWSYYYYFKEGKFPSFSFKVNRNKVFKYSFKYKYLNKYLYSHGFLKLRMVLSRVRKKGYIRALSLGYKHRLNLYKFTQYLVKYKSLLNKYRYNKSIIIVLMKFVQLYLMYILFVYKRI